MTLKEFIDAYEESNDKQVAMNFLLFERKNDKDVCTEDNIMFSKEGSSYVEEKYMKREVSSFKVFNISKEIDPVTNIEITYIVMAVVLKEN